MAHARGRARGSGARGCACIARLLLAAHTVHGSEGAGEGGTGPLAAPAAAAAPVRSSAPAQRRPPRRDPAAAVPSPSPLLPPPQPLINICTALGSSCLFHRSWCSQIYFFFNPFPRCAARSSLFGTLYLRHPLGDLGGQEQCSTPVACPGIPETLKNSEKVASSLLGAEEVASQLASQGSEASPPVRMQGPVQCTCLLSRRWCEPSCSRHDGPGAKRELCGR